MNKKLDSRLLLFSLALNLFLIISIILLASGCFVKSPLGSSLDNYFSNNTSKEINQDADLEKNTVDSYFNEEALGKGLPEDFRIVNEAWMIINSDFVNKATINPTKISQGAVRGMIDSLDDKYSAYEDPETFKAEQESFSGRFQGIGAYVGVNDKKQIVIIAPMDNSPAQKAGLKSGDIIIKINDENTIGMSVNEAATKIKGPAGTIVKLEILRPGADATQIYEIVRAEIKIQTVVYDVRDNIGYIKLTTFIETSDEDLRNAVKELNKAKVKGLILDLRNNYGGLLQTAINIVSMFQKDGVAVKLKDKNGKVTAIPLNKSVYITDLPLVVLINEGSASASEVVCGALQDYSRAEIIGKKSFGKGSAQILRTLSDGSAIRITNNYWLTPKDRLIEENGIVPDIESDLENDALINYAVEYLNNTR